MKISILYLFMFQLLFVNHHTHLSNNHSKKVRSKISPLCTDTGKEFVISQENDFSTDYVFKNRYELPTGFYFDTLDLFDSIYDANYTFYFLQSSLPGMQVFNNTFKSDLISLSERDKMYLDTIKDDKDLGSVYSFELGPFECLITDTLLSFCNVIDSYGEGGNHHNYSWYSFNYDLKSNSKIELKDVFNLHTTEDTIRFSDLILRRRIGEGCIDLEAPYASILDFSFVKKGICLNPSTSWSCGMIRAFIPYEEYHTLFDKK